MHWRLVFSLMMMELYKFDDIKKGKRCSIRTSERQEVERKEKPAHTEGENIASLLIVYGVIQKLRPFYRGEWV